MPQGAAGGGGLSTITPGISLLGKGSAKELLEDAEDQGIDMLVIFDVKVKENPKTGYVINEARLVVYNVAEKDDFVRTKTLNNITTQKHRADDKKDDDPVEVIFEKFFKDLDEDQEKRIALEDLPPFKPEHVMSRVKKIVDSQQMPKLAALAEIKFFHHRGLITDAAMTESFQKLLGELEGAKLAEGNEKERLAVVENLLPRDAK